MAARAVDHARQGVPVGDRGGAGPRVGPGLTDPVGEAGEPTAVQLDEVHVPLLPGCEQPRLREVVVPQIAHQRCHVLGVPLLEFVLALTRAGRRLLREVDGLGEFAVAVPRDQAPDDLRPGLAQLRHRRLVEHPAQPFGIAAAALDHLDEHGVLLSPSAPLDTGRPTACDSTPPVRPRKRHSAPLACQVSRVTSWRAWSAYSASTATAYWAACKVLVELKSRRPPVIPCATAPKAAPHAAPISTATTSTAHQAERLNRPKSNPMNSPNQAPLTAPASAARVVVSRPVTRSTRRRSVPTIEVSSTGNWLSDR